MNRSLFYCLVLSLGLLGPACEPLAPEPAAQVIIVTPTPSPAIGNPIPPSPTLPPSPSPAPSLTPSPAAIPTSTLPPCDKTEGTVYESTLTSAILPEGLAYQVYLPPCFFESGRRFPLMLLLHGTDQDNQHWLELGIKTTLEAGLAESPPRFAPMVLVMPEGGDLQSEARFEIGAAYEDLILRELLPEIEATLCVQKDSRGRGIAGIGRGAFWAYSIALRHPEVFSIIAGHSPWFLPDNAPITHNPLALAERAIPIAGQRFYLDHAQDDERGANTLIFSNTLRAQGIEHTYVINPVGGHRDSYWSGRLGDYLSFYSASLPFQIQEMPSCQE